MHCRGPGGTNDIYNTQDHVTVNTDTMGSFKSCNKRRAATRGVANRHVDAIMLLHAHSAPLTMSVSTRDRSANYTPKPPHKKHI
jgi:hypothetical protein